jgi:LPS-assembly lipoprotein
MSWSDFGVKGNAGAGRNQPPSPFGRASGNPWPGSREGLTVFALRLASLAAVAAAALLMSGCGYRPVYGDRSVATAGAAPLGSVKVQGIADRRGQLLRNFLLDRMNPRGEPAAPRYVLAVTTTEATRITDSRPDGTATRADIVVFARYALRDATSDLLVFSDRGEAVATYNLLTARFASVASEDEARRRAMEELADQISLQVALFLNRRHAAPARADKAR